jgi:hypothetical protein
MNQIRRCDNRWVIQVRLGDNCSMKQIRPRHGGHPIASQKLPELRLLPTNSSSPPPHRQAKRLFS